MKKIFPLVIFVVAAVAVHAQDVSYDKKVGAEAAVKLEQLYGISNYPASTQLLDSIGTRLVRNLGNQPFTYEFKIVNMVEPNAMTLPAGHIYFSRGILALANSEDELACVMGHEIIHAHKRHTIKAEKKKILPTIIKLPGNLIKVVSPSLGSKINAPLEGVSQLAEAKYSRKNETEADKLGVQLAAKSGYNPLALGDMLIRINSTVEFLTGQKQKFNYFDSHPFTPDRVATIKTESKTVTIVDRPEVTANRNDFLSRLDGIMISADPAQGVLHDSLFLHPDMGFSLVLPAGWKYQNTPVAVVATQKDDNAQMMLAVAGEAKDPTDYANTFMKEKLKGQEKSIIKNDKVTVNGLPGHLITIKESTRQGAVHGHILWLNFNHVTYQFIAIGTSAYESVMKDAVLSFRPITPEQRQSIQVLVLRIVKAQDGESLEALSKRTDSAASLDFLALINNVSKQATFRTGDDIKIVRTEIYEKH